MIQINKNNRILCILHYFRRNALAELGLSTIKEDPLQLESQVVKHPVVQQSVDASKDAVQRSFDVN